MNLLLIFISIFHKTLKKPCLCESDIYFLFGRFCFWMAIASKPFSSHFSCLYIIFLFLFSFPLSPIIPFSLLYSEQLSAGVRNCCRLSEFIFGKRAFTEEEGMQWALLYNDTTDCIFPQFCYSSYVKKIRSFLTLNIVVLQWVMYLSSMWIVVRITRGFSSYHMEGLSDTRVTTGIFSLTHTDTRTRRHTDTHACAHTHTHTHHVLSLSSSFRITVAGKVATLAAWRTFS